MNILFTGPYRQEDGWGIAARHYLKALATKYNVTAKHIKLAGSRLIEDETLDKLENTHYKDYDILIQKSLPKFWVYDDRFKYNIGMIATETYGQDFDNYNFELVDKILVSSKIERNALKDNNPRHVNKIYDVGLPFQLDTNSTDENFFAKSVHEGLYVFYFIGEFSERKSIQELVHAYLSEFCAYEDNVLLFLKCYIPGMTDQQSHDHIAKAVDTVRKSCRRFFDSNAYPPILLTTSWLSPEQIQDIHEIGNCYMNISKGEANCLPAYQAYLNNNIVINTQGLPATTFMPTNTLEVESYRDKTLCNKPPIATIYTANEEWLLPSIKDAGKKMRRAMSMLPRKIDDKFFTQEYFLNKFEKALD